ncbi:MAG: helix-turn-helix transcriptional regulator [Ruminococcaceae bacterium]|nr:helix-turn-helix transcriptional regulator [Oscillospiraceae bacterium]
MQYHEILKNLRIDHDKSQKEIAELLQTTQTYYSKYELGKHPLPIHHLITLCQYYGVSADYILGLPKGLPYGLSKTK